LIQQLSALGYPITPMIHLTLEEKLYDLEASFGICNRIFMSPIPPTYTRHTSRVLCLFLFLLPINFAGSKTSPAALLLGVAAITYVLVGIDEIGLEIEYVFPLLPMQQMASTYQKNVLNQFMLLSNAPNDN
jgi:ion channel-forming bestrophin family protein